MDESERLTKARALRRAMLGDEYVDGQVADPDPVAAAFQDYVTSMAWGVCFSCAWYQAAASASKS